MGDYYQSYALRARVHLAFFSDCQHLLSNVLYEQRGVCSSRQLLGAKTQRPASFFWALYWAPVEISQLFRKELVTSPALFPSGHYTWTIQWYSPCFCHLQLVSCTHILLAPCLNAGAVIVEPLLLLGLSSIHNMRVRILCLMLIVKKNVHPGPKVANRSRD